MQLTLNDAVNPTKNCIVSASTIYLDTITTMPVGWFPIGNNAVPLKPTDSYSNPTISTQQQSLKIMTPSDISSSDYSGNKLTFNYWNLNAIQFNDGKISLPYLEYSSRGQSSSSNPLSSSLNELELTGFTFDDILRPRQLKENISELAQYSTAELRKNFLFNKEKYFKNFKNSFPQLKYTNYLDVDASNNKLSEVNFVFKENGIFFNKLVPVALLTQTKCAGITLDYDKSATDMEIICEDKGFRNNNENFAIISVKLITNLIETPDFDEELYNRGEALELSTPKKGGLGTGAIVGIVIGCIVVVVIIVVVIVCIRDRKSVV